MEAEPIVLVALVDFHLSGRSIRAGDRIVIEAGKYVRLVQDLPLDYGPIMGADLAGQLDYVMATRQQLASLARVVGGEADLPSAPSPTHRSRDHLFLLP